MTSSRSAIRMSTSTSARPSPRGVVIRTLPPRTGNYGGILQAYALQTIVRRLAGNAVTDVSERSPLTVTLRRGSVRLLSRMMRRPIGYVERWRSANSDVLRFVAEEMETTRLFASNRWVRKRQLDSFGAFVVGSDQVWRPEYGDLPSYLLDFLPPADIRPRIAYAASFGIDTPSIDLPEARDLIGRFSAVSVREESAATFCADSWGITPSVVIDPTMLLRREDYSGLIEQWRARVSAPRSAGRIVSYILDKDPRVEQIVEEVLNAREDQGENLSRPLPRSAREFRQDPSPFMRLSVEAWLEAIQGADGIITDSFHGCVFAILFNRPFIVLGNSKRGMARFETLLRKFGLEEQLVLSAGQPETADEAAGVARRAVDALSNSIDWSRVNERIEEERQAGIQFLGFALG